MSHRDTRAAIKQALNQSLPDTEVWSLPDTEVWSQLKIFLKSILGNQN